jgi:hypothetical protein
MLADNLIAGYAFELNGETFAGVGFSFDDAGDNLCTVAPASLTALQTFVALNDVLDIINLPPSLQSLLPGGLGSLLGSAGSCGAVSVGLEPPEPPDPI